MGSKGSKATKQRQSLGKDADPSHLLSARRDESQLTEEANQSAPKCCSFLDCLGASTKDLQSLHTSSGDADDRRQRRRKQRVTILIVGAEGVGKSQLAKIMESETVGGAPLASTDLRSINMHHARREIARIKKDASGKLCS
jgi:ABC-type bacteriocin/lantibiotic exporters, contain an N-terminal double-glycine peptidase domain